MSELSKLVIKAYHIAEEAHRGQTRKYSGDPFIVHPVRVSYRAVANVGWAVAYTGVQVVSLLHDTIEDTDETVESLKDKGMGGWADVVDVLTRKDDVTYFDYIRSIRKYAEDNEGEYHWSSNTAIHVKVADIKDNLTDMPPHDPTNQLHVHTKEHSLHKRYRKALQILGEEL